MLGAVEDECDSSKPYVAFAGAVAGVISDTLLHPFDTVSHRAKVHPSSGYGSFMGAYGVIIREEGLRGLLAGASVTLSFSGPATGMYFWAYASIKEQLMKFATSERDRQLVYLASGAAAEMAAALLFVPADVVRCRLQLGSNPSRATGGLVARSQNYAGAVHAVRTIVKEEGVRALWQGWNAYLAQECAFSAVQFMVYENIRRAVMAVRRRKPTHLESFAAGGVAGAVAAAVTNPLDTITARMMSQDRRDGRRGFGGGLWQVLAATMREGRGSLWRGTGSRMLYAAPATAIQFAVFEAVRSWLEQSGWGGGAGGSSGSGVTNVRTIPGARETRHGASGGAQSAKWVSVFDSVRGGVGNPVLDRV